MFDINNSLGQKLKKLKRNTWFCQKWCLRAYFSHLLIILNGIFAVVGGPHRFQSASIVTFHRHALEFFTEAIMLPSAAAYPDCKTTLNRITAHNYGELKWHLFSPSLSCQGKRFGPRHCLTKCALVENKLLNQNCWSWYHFSQEKLPYTLIRDDTGTIPNFLNLTVSAWTCW